MKYRSFAAPAPSETTLELITPVPTADSLYQLIQILLPEGYPPIALVAASAGMSIRSFQRRLADYHLSYSEVIERVRFNEAIRLLREPAIKVIDIAFDLGYSDAASFTRAFRRWTGLSPREFRHHVDLGLAPKQFPGYINP